MGIIFFASFFKVNRFGYISSIQCYITHTSCQLCFIGKDLQKGWKSSKWTELFLIFKIPEKIKTKLYPGKEYDVLPEAERSCLSLCCSNPHSYIRRLIILEQTLKPAAKSCVFNGHLPFPILFTQAWYVYVPEEMWSSDDGYTVECSCQTLFKIGSANFACGFLLIGNLPGLALTLLMTNPNRCYFPVKLFIPFVTRRQLWRLIIYLLLLPPWVPRLPSWYLDACCEVGAVILNLDAVSLHLPVYTEKFLSFLSQSYTSCWKRHFPAVAKSF